MFITDNPGILIFKHILKILQHSNFDWMII